MRAMLYQLTASAARMCMPVPIAAPDSWVDRLDHWQTLAGNWVGGLLGVTGALIVAVMIRRRDRRIAAGMVLPDLQQLAAAGDALEKSLPHLQSDNPGPFMRAQENTRLEGQRIAMAFNRLAERPPGLFALHTPVIGQLSDVDVHLYSHLFQCEMTHRRFEEGLVAQEALMDAAMAAPMDGAPGFRARARVPAPAQIYRDWQRSVEHATLAAYFLDRLVFSRWPRWMHRIRMRLLSNDFDRRSSHLIKTGEILNTPQPSAEPATSPQG